MEIRSLVNRNVLALGPDHTLLHAAEQMTRRRVGSAVVVSDDGAPGIITERDLLQAMAQGVDAGTAKVKDFMTPEAMTASPSWDTRDAARKMLEAGFRHLVVLKDNGSVEGVLSIRDLAGALLDELTTR